MEITADLAALEVIAEKPPAKPAKPQRRSEAPKKRVRRPRKKKATEGVPALAHHQGDVLLTETDAAEFLRLTPRALQAWRFQGKGPQLVRLSGRVVRYRRIDLQGG